MKCFLVFTTLLLIISCGKNEKKEALYSESETVQTPESLGQEIFDGKGMCYSCHLENKKVVGPSITEIAAIYKAKNGNIVQFLKEKADPIVNPSQYETMKTNFAITKNLPEEELKALEAYMMSFSK